MADARLVHMVQTFHYVAHELADLLLRVDTNAIQSGLKPFQVFVPLGDIALGTEVDHQYQCVVCLAIDHLLQLDHVGSIELLHHFYFFVDRIQVVLVD